MIHWSILSNLPWWKRPAPIRQALTVLFPVKDILVHTPEEVDDWKAVPNAFITTILREGKVLYIKIKTNWPKGGSLKQKVIRQMPAGRWDKKGWK
jgi:hypothetical protein